MPSQITFKLEDGLTLVELIGKGAYCRVYSGFTKDNEKIAVKVPIDTHGKRAIKNEIDIMRRLSTQSPFICPIIRIGNLDRFLVLPLLDRRHLGQLVKYPLEKKLICLREALGGLVFLHDNEILHRDIKPSNIMVDEKNGTKIIDFGLSAPMSLIRQEDPSFTPPGSPFYMAPEILRVKYLGQRWWNRDSFSPDIYAFAITAWVCIHTSEPWTDRNGPMFARKITRGARPQKTKHFDQHDGLWDWLAACWHEDQNARPSAVTALAMLIDYEDQSK